MTAPHDVVQRCAEYDTGAGRCQLLHQHLGRHLVYLGSKTCFAWDRDEKSHWRTQPAAAWLVNSSWAPGSGLRTAYLTFFELGDGARQIYRGGLSAVFQANAPVSIRYRHWTKPLTPKRGDPIFCRECRDYRRVV